MNVVVEYLYRDAGNNKIWGEAIFSNNEKIDHGDLLHMIRKRLIDGEFFVAKKAGVASLHFKQHDDDELDHEWHEFHDINPANNQSYTSKKDIMSFINVL